MADLHAIEPESVSPSLVEALEEVLEKARAGELSSVAIAYVYRDGCIANCWSAPPSFGLLLGSVARLQHHMNLTRDRQ